MQTLEPSLLALLGRRATREQNLAALELLRTRWQGGVSVDLLAGIPGQTWERLAEDIETVLSFDPQHVSLYSLTREEGTLFDRMILAKKLKEMPAAEQDRLWLRGVRLLRERGFEHYEISNFAPAGLECRHNERYWRLDPYLGIGPAAVSTLPGGSTGVLRVTEARSVHAWLAGANPALEEVPARDFFFENLMMGLRLAAGVPRERVRRRFGDRVLQWLLEEWARLAGDSRHTGARPEARVDAERVAPAEPPARAAPGGRGSAPGRPARLARWACRGAAGLRAVHGAQGPGPSPVLDLT